jgi:mono/diheme cytochrome c family protein
MRRTRFGFAGVLLIAGLACAWPAQAQDAARGRQLYETHCGGCHYERLHQRERSRSKIRSLVDLRVEVARWAKETGHSLPFQDLDDIAEYLNRSHYRLEK